MKKITFIGDITSDRPLLNAAYDRNTDAYDFSPVFGKVKKSVSYTHLRAHET